jgi:hypothetical protein
MLNTALDTKDRAMARRSLAGLPPPPPRPKPPQDHPEQFIGNGKLRPRMLQFQNGELLPKGQVFQEQIAADRTVLIKRANRSLSVRGMSQL